ncbi:hypothetical protein ACS0TY_022523 [Phlomoides rotata]
MDPLCARCGGDVESAEHALRDCSWVHAYWSSTPFSILLTNDMLHVWVKRLLFSLEEEQQCLLATTLWLLWTAHNNCLFSKISCSADDLGYKVADHRLCFLASARLQMGRGTAGCGVDRWLPPEPGVCKLNVDASIKRGLGSSFAGVLRNNSGEVVWCLSKWQEGGLEIARQNGVGDVVVESDSQTVVFALNLRKNDLSYFGRIIQDIEGTSAAFERCCFKN